MDDEEAERHSMSLYAILDIADKKALVEHCKQAIIQGRDLANLILASQTYAVPIIHCPVFKHHHPEHLELNTDDLAALARNGVGPLQPRAKKTANKIEAMFEQRRLFCGHLFCPLANDNEWHFFYFDQRDTRTTNNHWRDGAHIHLLNWVTHPRWTLNDLAQEVDASDRPRLTGSLHIRYEQ